MLQQGATEILEQAVTEQSSSAEVSFYCDHPSQ